MNTTIPRMESWTHSEYTENPHFDYSEFFLLRIHDLIDVDNVLDVDSRNFL